MFSLRSWNNGPAGLVWDVSWSVYQSVNEWKPFWIICYIVSHFHVHYHALNLYQSMPRGVCTVQPMYILKWSEFCKIASYMPNIYTLQERFSSWSPYNTKWNRGKGILAWGFDVIRSKTLCLCDNHSPAWDGILYQGSFM